MGFITQHWVWKVICAEGDGPNPLLSNMSVPDLGKKFSFDLSEAKASTPALLSIGAPNKKWGPIKLPFDPVPVAATECSLLCAGEIQIPFRTSPTGTSSQGFTVPKQASLLGLLFYGHYVISDNHNPLDLVCSNGGRGKIGER